MKDLNIACPPKSWPEDLDGCIALGVTKMQEEKTLWLVFRIQHGSVISISGLISEGKEIPLEIEQLHPIIYASGAKQLWLLINKDKEDFYRKVAEAKLHIGGDFREFGRLTSRLICLAEQTGLWKRLDEIFEEVLG